MSNYHNESMIYIEENYSPNNPLDLSDVNWQFFLIILFSVLFIISLIVYIIQFKHAIHSTLYCRTKTVKKILKKSKPLYSAVGAYTYGSVFDADTYFYGSEEYKNSFNALTATECIYKLFDDNNIHHTILDIILKDYCGFANPPSLDSITERKQQILSKRRNIACYIGCKLLLIHILQIILISSLLCATYCGVIFIIQNQDNLKKYSTFVQCECVDKTDLCKAEDYPVDYFGFDKMVQFDPAYDSFYDDIWLPYITQYEPSLINHFQSNNSLLIKSSNGKSYKWCPDEEWSWDTNYEQGWLYLNMNGLSESDFVSNFNRSTCRCFDDNGKGCCGCNDKPCCSCCVGWVTFAVLCLILCILLALIVLAYINYPIEQDLKDMSVNKIILIIPFGDHIKSLAEIIRQIRNINSEG